MSYPLPFILAMAAGLVTGVAAQPFGIEAPRLPNRDLRLSTLPADQPGTMQLVRAFPRLTFPKAVLLLESPDTSGRLFVVSQTGRVYTFPRQADPDPATSTVFLDIVSRTWDSGERGLLGMAFDPDYAINGHVYISYVTYGGEGVSRLSRFTNPNPASNVLPANSEQIILQVPQDFSNHNGGMVAFGHDGMLYWGLGDGGSSNDPRNRAQDTTTLLGSILRLDVRTPPPVGQSYVVPPDNPFVAGGPAGTATRPEIWAYGLRNPWRFSFDRLYGHLIVADVGQGALEEVNVITRGGNYGWRVMEGTRCNFSNENCNNPLFIPPITEYPHTVGRSISGGFVYYGSRVPQLYGVYIYGDYATGIIQGLRYTGTSPVTPFTLVPAAGFNISGFGQDNAGEVYVLDYRSSGGGGVYTLAPVVPPTGSFPTRLSELPALHTAGSGRGETIDGVIPYRPAAQLWSDGAHKERYLALPDLAQATFRPAGGWDFPDETVLIKNFILPLDLRDPVGSAKRIETRIMLRLDNAWHGFTYEWNEDETDAVLLTGSKTRPFTITGTDGRTFAYDWFYPSRTDCFTCHTPAANFVLGLSTPQMNSVYTYPASGIRANQLSTLEYLSIFDAPLPAPVEQLSAMPDPFEPAAASTALRARAYLEANCAMCHQPGGPVPGGIMDLRWETSTAGTNTVGVAPIFGHIGIPNGLIIAPAEPDRSILPARMAHPGPPRMPPLASSRIDTEGLALIREWIATMNVPTAHGWHVH